MTIARRPRGAARREPWRALVQFPGEVGCVIDQLANLESRKRAGMAKRLILEALSARGLWDLERNEPVASDEVPAPRSGEHPRRHRG